MSANPPPLELTRQIGKAERLNERRLEMGMFETAMLTRRGPPAMAIPFLVFGAFFAGYQLLRIGDINFTIADLMFALAFAICLARGQLTAIPFGQITSLWYFGLAMMLGGLFIGTVFHGDMLRWIIIACQYLTGFLLLPMLLMAQPLSVARRMTAAFIAGIVAMEIFGIAISLTMTHHEAAAIFSDEFVAGNGRLSSFAAEPNWNGAIIAFTAPLLIYAYVTRLIPAWLVAIMVPILGWALMLSASFTGFAATMVALSITLLFLGLRYLGGMLVIAALAAALFFASGAPVPAVFEKRVGNAISDGDLAEAGTYKGRVKLIRQAWHTADDTLIVGLGADQFRTTNEIRQPVHNLYLLMLTEGGLLSLTGLLTLVFLLLWAPLSRLGQTRMEAGVTLAVVAVFIIYSQSSPHMFSRLIIVPVLLSLMILYGSMPRLPQRSYAGQPVHPLRRPRAEIANGHPAAMR